MCAYQNKIEIFSDTKSSVLGKLGRILFGALVLVAMVWVWYELEQIGTRRKKCTQSSQIFTGSKRTFFLLLLHAFFGFYHVATLELPPAFLNCGYMRDLHPKLHSLRCSSLDGVHIFFYHICCPFLSKVPYNSICPFLQLSVPLAPFLDFFFCVIFHNKKKKLN